MSRTPARPRPSRRWRPALLLGALAAPAGAHGQEAPRPPAPAPACPARPFRWQEDCSVLAGADLQGAQQLRYLPLADDGAAWLTFGGEARARMDLLHDIDFGIHDQPGYTEISGRLLAHADLRTRAGPRVFVQLGVVAEDGRKPGPRGQDESAIDVTQAFVDLPAQLGAARLVARLGRQEMDLSGNRLISPRDGSTLRRTYEGAKLDVFVAGAKVALVSVRPMEFRDAPFADRPDSTERFNAVSVDLPHSLTGEGLLNVFAFDRHRHDARFLRAHGNERRYSLGVRYAGPLYGWRVDGQATWQVGRAQGQPVRAHALAVSLDRDLGGPWSIGFDAVASSGDKAGTRRIETFDPTYPNNGGLSDAPLFYQTNYVFAGGGLSARWHGATWSAQSNLLARDSTTDALYANGRPVDGDFGGGRLTSLLSQVSVRKPFGPNREIYASLVRAQALTSVRHAGGRDALYSRIQLTARF